MEPQIYSGYRICNTKIPSIGKTSRDISKHSKCCDSGGKELDEKPTYIKRDIPGWRANVQLFQPEKKVIKAVPIKQMELPSKEMQKKIEKVVIPIPAIVSAPVEVPEPPKAEDPKAEVQEEKKEEEKKLEEILLLKPQIPVPSKQVQHKPDILLIHDQHNEKDVKDVLEKLKTEENEIGKAYLLNRENVRKDTVPKANFIAFHFFSNPSHIFPHELNSIQNKYSGLCKNNCVGVALDRSQRKSSSTWEEIEKTGFVGLKQFEKRYITATDCSAGIPQFLTKNSFPELMKNMRTIYQEFANTL